ncbi:MAG: hypothetical protein E6R12_03515 [Sphingomonadales bacterium]|nr:MAG: hypothetical protein E6R12_03515 [Sphingomonadales bacterium]
MGYDQKITGSIKNMPQKYSLKFPRLIWQSVGILAAIGTIHLGYLATNVDTSVTSANITSIIRLNINSACVQRDSFESEVRCVEAIQTAQLKEIPDLTCVNDHVSREPEAAIERGRACCFTRSRLIEKALTHFGFKVRHVSMHVLSVPIIGYIMPVRDSHAASEVLTSRGWMFVDSLQVFRAITRDGKPLTAPELRRLEDFSALDKPPANPSFYHMHYTSLYGLYSRHGQFYPPYLPLPDIAWSQVFYNFE